MVKVSITSTSCLTTVTVKVGETALATVILMVKVGEQAMVLALDLVATTGMAGMAIGYMGLLVGKERELDDQ